MKKKCLLIAAVLLSVFSLPVWAQPGVNYSFGDWATATGLATNATYINAEGQGITNLNGLSNFSNLQNLVLNDNLINTIKSNDFVGLNSLQYLSLSQCNIFSIETDAFSTMNSLYSLDIGHNPYEILNFSDARLCDLTFYNMRSSGGIVNLTNAEIMTQQAFSSMMEGGGSSFYGIAEVPYVSVTEIIFAGADLKAVAQFDEMFIGGRMANLKTLNLANVAFSDSIVSTNYVEILDMVNSLEGKSLDFLTIDNTLYSAQKSYFDTWDAGANNEITVVPEPATLSLLTIGLISLIKRKRK